MADWTREDLEYLLAELDKGPLAVADPSLGVPTIHEIRGARHLGYGYFLAETPDYKVSFDAGGAMSRTPSGNGWTRLGITGRYPYDADQVRATLQAAIAALDA